MLLVVGIPSPNLGIQILQADRGDHHTDQWQVSASITQHFDVKVLDPLPLLLLPLVKVKAKVFHFCCDLGEVTVSVYVQEEIFQADDDFTVFDIDGVLHFKTDSGNRPLAEYNKRDLGRL